jgi:hypothetical protein
MLNQIKSILKMKHLYLLFICGLLCAATFTARAQSGVNPVDLGDGMSLWSTDDDPSGCLLEIKVDDEQFRTSSVNLGLLPERIFNKFNDDFDIFFIVYNRFYDPSMVGSTGARWVCGLLNNKVQGIGSNVYRPKDQISKYGNIHSHIIYGSYVENDYSLFLHEICHSWAVHISPYALEFNNRPAAGHWGVSNANGAVGGYTYVHTVEENSGDVAGKTLYLINDIPDSDDPYIHGNGPLSFSDIELYLAGLKSAQELRDADFHLDMYTGAEQNIGDGTVAMFYATGKSSYTIDDIISINGPRIPDASVSKKQFKILTVVLSPETATGERDCKEIIMQDMKWMAGAIDDLSIPDNINFRQATNNRGSLIVNGLKNSLKSAGIPVTCVHLDKTELFLYINSTEQLKTGFEPAYASNRAVTWTSSNPAVAGIDETGLVTAIAEGTAIITATAQDGGHTVACTVTVAAAALNGTTGSLSWRIENGTLTVGGIGSMPNYAKLPLRGTLTGTPLPPLLLKTV